MARNEELYNQLKYVCDIMEQFTEHAEACELLGPWEPYESVFDFRYQTETSVTLFGESEYGNWIAIERDEAFRADQSSYEFDEAAYLEHDCNRQSGDYMELELSIPRVAEPERPVVPAILQEPDPGFLFPGKRRARALAEKEYQQQMAEYDRACERARQQEEQRHATIRAEVDRRAKARLERARKHNEEWIKNELDRVNAYVVQFEQANAYIAEENEKKRLECQARVAEMERLQKLFESATASGWYPPAFRTLDACKFFLFAVDNQIVQSEEELAKAYMEELRHRELLDAINKQGADMVAACERIRHDMREVAHEASREISSAVQESADLLMREMSKGNMAVLDAMAKASADADAREKLQTDSLSYIYLSSRFLDNVFQTPREVRIVN